MPKKRVLKSLTKALEEGLMPVRPRTVYGWIQEKRYTNLVFKLFGKVVVDMNELEKLIEEAKRGAHENTSGCSGGCTCSKRSHAKKTRRR